MSYIYAVYYTHKVLSSYKARERRGETYFKKIPTFFYCVID